MGGVGLHPTKVLVVLNLESTSYFEKLHPPNTEVYVDGRGRDRRRVIHGMRGDGKTW